MSSTLLIKRNPLGTTHIAVGSSSELRDDSSFMGVSYRAH